LDAWERHETEIAAVLNKSDSGEPDGTSLLAKVIDMAPDIPAGRQTVATVFCHGSAGDGTIRAGVRLSSRDLPQQPPVYVTLCTVENEAYYPTHPHISEDDAVTLGNLVVGKVKWARLRGVRLTDDHTEIILPTPALPAATEL
jgi:hypothetical protein